MSLPFLLVVALAASPLDSTQAPPPGPLPAGASAPSAAAPLAFDWVRDGAITGTATLLWVVSDTVAKPALAPDTCRWCDRDPATGADTLDGLDAWGRRTFRAVGAEPQVARVSDAMAFGVVPVTTLGVQTLLAAQAGALPQAAEDALMVGEAVALTAVVTQVVKFSLGRERPFVHGAWPGAPAEAAHPEDFNLSFFSGHSSFAFSTVVAAGTVASLRGREGQWLVWTVGLPLATAVPLLRMGADKHYLTDVLVGSAVGAAMGWAVPTLLHPRLGRVPGVASLQVAAGPGSVALSGTF